MSTLIILGSFALLALVGLCVLIGLSRLADMMIELLIVCFIMLLFVFLGASLAGLLVIGAVGYILYLTFVKLKEFIQNHY